MKSCQPHFGPNSVRKNSNNKLDLVLTFSIKYFIFIRSC